MLTRPRALCSLVLACIGCGGSEPARPGCDEACLDQGTFVSMDFTGKQGFYGAPFPTDARRTQDGRPDVAAFPNPKSMDLVKRVLALLAADATGFGTTSAIYFRLSAALDPAELPDLHASVATGSPIVLIGVDSASPDYLKRYPISISFAADAGPYGADNLLSLLPLQGIPLRPGTRYAAVVLRDLHDASGKKLGRSPEMAKLAAGERPDGMDEKAGKSHAEALEALGEAGVEAASIAGLAVFTTGTPTDAFGKVTSAMLAAPLPAITSPFALNETFDDYCVYETTIPMPEYQAGDPPYTSSGGEWVFDASGAPVLQRMEEANFVVTVPRAQMPAAGYPIVVMSRTGGGGERPLVDRGVQAMTGGPAITPGTGPALYFAKAGFAGSSVDGPHGGLRNVTHGDEQFLMFNIGNPGALRDNTRQSAAELALQAHVLAQITIDVSDCAGAVAPNGLAHFDSGTMALMGHSMGATIAPLTLAFEPLYRAGLLSGAGGSYIENVMFKLHPLAVKGFAEVLVGLAGTGHGLTEHDPVLSIFQWAAEGADPPVYGDLIIEAPAAGAPRHVLMMQGIVDNYILPPIANATSLSFGLDLAGPEIDMDNPGIAQFTPLGALLDLSGKKAIALPAKGNIDGTVTAVVTQHPEDGVEDGHEVMFQTDPPKRQYRCFLESLAKGGAPSVPGPGGVFDPCE